MWLAAWLWLYHDPATHPRLGAQERVALLAELAADHGAVEPPVPTWRSLAADRPMWGLLLSRFVADGSFYFVVFWLP